MPSGPILLLIEAVKFVTVDQWYTYTVLQHPATSQRRGVRALWQEGIWERQPDNGNDGATGGLAPSLSHFAKTNKRH